MSSKRLGTRIKAVRQERGLTQIGLAKRAKIRPIYLAQIEGSAKNPPSRTPSLSMLQRLAKALQVTVGGAGAMTPEERDALIAYVSEVEKFITVYALRFAWLKALLIQKGPMTAEELERAVKMVEAAFTVEEARDPRVEALDRLRKWIEEQR